MVNMKPYSEALLELSQEQDCTSEIREQLDACSQVWKDNPELILLLEHPKVLRKDKEALLHQVLDSSMHPLLVRFIDVLIHNNCAAYVPQAYDALLEAINDAENKEVVTVETARPLDSDQQKRLQEVLSEKLKKNIVLDIKENPALIGGLRVQTKEYVLDNTVIAKADRIKEAIKKES